MAEIPEAMVERTLKDIGGDLAEAVALVPAGVHALSIMYLASLKKFSVFIHLSAGRCESAMAATAVSAAREALRKLDAEYSFIESYDEAVTRSAALTKATGSGS